MKILSIGNSFSQDAVEYLAKIAQGLGIDMIVGNLYIGGCSLNTHRRNAEQDASNYTYYKLTCGGCDILEEKSLLYGLLDEEWDIVTLQQRSGHSGMPQTYGSNLTRLIQYVRRNTRDKSAALAWHMTWAYQSDCPNDDFALYGNNQQQMYSAIVGAVKEIILPTREFSFIIPVGTALQNARMILGDALTRDGYHLDLGIGRYIAGLTWFTALTGRELDGITYLPDGVSPAQLPIAAEVVRKAVRDPFRAT